MGKRVLVYRIVSKEKKKNSDLSRHKFKGWHAKVFFFFGDVIRDGARGKDFI